MPSKYYKRYKKYKKYYRKKRYNKYKKYYKKKKNVFTKKQYKIVKSVAQKVLDNPSNVEYKQLKAPVEFCNFSTYRSSGANPNCIFYPLTCLGQLGTKLAALNSMGVTNFIKFINSGDSNGLGSNGTGYVSGTKISIKSIQVKGVMRFNRDKESEVQELSSYCGTYGFRIVRQKVNLNDTFINNYSTARTNKIIPNMQCAYKNLPGNFNPASNAELKQLRTIYNKDPAFYKDYDTLMSVYFHVDRESNVYKNKEFKVNRIKIFKKPLEISWNTAADILNTVDNGFYLSNRNNLYLCPFFSKVDGGIEADGYADAFCYFDGCVYINYFDR